MKTYEVLPLTTISGKTFWFACEVFDTIPFNLVTIGPGCPEKENAQEILDSFLDET
jgi:hypothetical protein